MSKKTSKTGSAVAVYSRIGRPGGVHGRRKPPRAVAKARAIRESA